MREDIIGWVGFRFGFCRGDMNDVRNLMVREGLWKTIELGFVLKGVDADEPGIVANDSG